MLRQVADKIIKDSINKVLPDTAVDLALKDLGPVKGDIYMVAIGKAAWKMAEAAQKNLGNRLKEGYVITKYEHVAGEIPNTKCFEAGHPVPDKNSFQATNFVIERMKNLSEDDKVIFLVSGGGSALFESPLIDEEEMGYVTEQMLASGADIREINTIRKRLSAVKGGKFAEICKPASIFSIVLSDIIGDPLDSIASGPAYPDSTDSESARKIVEKYGLKLSDRALEVLEKETPKKLDNVETIVTGSVKNLCKAAAQSCKEMGYEPMILTELLDCEAKEAGYFLGAIGRSHSHDGKKIAFIAGGETVVYLTGKGKGGRNQEIALAAAEKIAGLDNVAVFSVGSDGTDGPTDAAGGYVDGQTKNKLSDKGISIYKTLQDNDAYQALEKVGGLIITGPTGTNVNDFAVVLIDA